MKQIAAGLAVISMGGSGAGVGIVFGGFLMALARNPGCEDELFRYCILGFAITEAGWTFRSDVCLFYCFF